MEAKPLLAAFERAAQSGLFPPGASVLLAVSGGSDSMALLYGAFEAAPETGWRLSVGHVHHGWRGRAADRDLAFVREHARRLGLPFFSRHRDARREARRLKLSPEAGARRVRYEALREMAREAGTSLIATAHQLDDRLESYLMARERGTRGAALAGPRERREDGIVRPLLEVSRRELRGYLLRRGVGFRRDSTNGDLALARARARRQLTRIAREGGEEALAKLEREVRRAGRERERVDRDFGEKVVPVIHAGPDSVLADALVLSECDAEVQRRAIDRMAAPFAAPGRSPVTGREAEQILQRLVLGGDFRFEAGRRVRFERKGRILKAGPAPGTAWPAGNNSPGSSVILKAVVKESFL